MKTQEFINALNDEAIAKGIAEAEKGTSGEIRVFVSENQVEDALRAAQRQFLRLGMDQTAQRNGVLIYFAPLAQQFAVLGDKGVHERCGTEFWQHITDDMTPLLKAGKHTEAILLAVREIGQVLARHFPIQAGDRNELPNQVARGNERPEGI